MPVGTVVNWTAPKTLNGYQFSYTEFDGCVVCQYNYGKWNSNDYGEQCGGRGDVYRSAANGC